MTESADTTATAVSAIAGSRLRDERPTHGLPHEPTATSARFTQLNADDRGGIRFLVLDASPGG